MSVKDYDRWGLVGLRYDQKGNDAQGAGQEIRWGDSKQLNVTALAAGGTFRPAITTFEQLVQVNRPARVWSLALSLEWMNPTVVTLAAGESLTALFSVITGIGSGFIRRAFDLQLAGPLAPAFPEFGIEIAQTVPDIPAGQLIISATVIVVTVAAGGNRQYALKTSAQVAPIER